MKKLYPLLLAILACLLAFLISCQYSGVRPLSVEILPDSATLLFHDNFETGETLTELGYSGNTKDGVTAMLSDSLSVSGAYSLSFPVAGLNLRKKFSENGVSGIRAEWNARVPASGSFAAYLMQDGTSVIRTILFAGNWCYYDESGQRNVIAPYTYNAWMNLKIEAEDGLYKAFMNDSLVAEGLPMLNGKTRVNTLYYSLGSKTALVDDIKVNLLHVRQPHSTLVENESQLNQAINQAYAGDTIVMKNGVWSDIDILFTGNGTPDQPITLKAETPGQVFISGSSSMRIAGEHLVVDGLHFKDGYSSKSLHLIEFRNGSAHAHHCRITNTAITAFNKPSGTDVWVGIFGTHNRVDNSAFIGKESQSALMIVWRATPDSNFHRIDHNYFSDMPSIGLGGAIAIRIGDGTQALSNSVTTVDSNLFENMLGIGKIINIKSSGNIIRGNTFRKASGSICIRHGNNNLIEGNYILPGLKNNYTGGILVIGSDHIIRNNYIQGTRRTGKPAIVLYNGDSDNYPGKGSYYPTRNVHIQGNTLVDNDRNIRIGQQGQVAGMPDLEMDIPVENITYINNAVLGNNDSIAMIDVLDPPEGTLSYEGNFFFGGDTTGLSNIAGISIQDPLLYLGADSLYHYHASSPLKDNIQGSPLQRAAVGPSWLN